MTDFAARFDQLRAPPIFIVGAARSGTTWLLDIFKAHPLVAVYHESWLFTKHNGLLPLLSSAHDPEKGKGLGRFLSREEIRQEVRRTAQSILGRAIQPQHEYLVEKSPNHLFSVDAIRSVFPGAKIIHVLRDGRDVAVSARAAARSWAPDWKKSFARSIGATAVVWREHCRVAASLPQTLGSDFLEVRYEQLHADPLKMYRRVFNFAGIPYADELLDRIQSVTDFKTHLDAGQDKFYRTGRVGDWRSDFSLLDAVRFNRRAGDMLIETGYERNRFWLPHLLRHRKQSSS